MKARTQLHRTQHQQKGFTLVELLVVLGLLSAFTYLSFRLLAGGLDIWRLADESRDQEERARVVLELLRRDLGVCDGAPKSRFVVDHGETQISNENHGRVRLRFVRTASRADEARMRLGFAAPTGGPTSLPAGQDTAADVNSGNQQSETAVTPRSGIGLFEVAYSTASDPQRKDGALSVLRRAVQFLEPNDPEKSIFTKDYFEKVKGGFGERSAEVAGGVLHFGLSLMSQFSTSRDVNANTGGPETAWDSTRHDFLLPSALGPSKFRFASAEPLDPRERVYPRRVLITLILEREDQDRRVVRLDKPVDASTREFPLADPRPLSVAQGELIKIGSEWVEAASGDSGVLRLRMRGALGTRSSSHSAGLAIHRGRVFRLEVPLDCFRDAEAR